VFLEFIVKSPAADSELLGRLFFVALSGGESHQDEFALDGIKSHARVDRTMLTRGICLCGIDRPDS
jgi:hypothetical protein